MSKSGAKLLLFSDICKILIIFIKIIAIFPFFLFFAYLQQPKHCPFLRHIMPIKTQPAHPQAVFLFVHCVQILFGQSALALPCHAHHPHFRRLCFSSFIASKFYLDKAPLRFRATRTTRIFAGCVSLRSLRPNSIWTKRPCASVPRALPYMPSPVASAAPPHRR